MEEVLKDIIEAIRENGPLDELELGRLLNRHNKDAGGDKRAYSKKRLLPYYLKLRESEPEKLEAWGIDDALEAAIFQTLRMKPRRTASGVATITVITKPQPCAGACLYCPNDVRMPKSYLHREPACQRAERNYFDPYLQVISRLRALTQMGHICDKIELIVLGGSWTDYPLTYQTWFIEELFRALNEANDFQKTVRDRREQYRRCGIDSRQDVLETQSKTLQEQVNIGALSFNEAVRELYGEKSAWTQTRSWQEATLGELAAQQHINETNAHRVVGLVVETRPGSLDVETLARLRSFGCTKIQIGVQSLRPEILALNNREDDDESLLQAFELLRLFGFKIHTHFMVNLFGSEVEADKRDYDRFVSDPAFCPDEVKIYPCALVAGTGLNEKYRTGEWRPYTEAELVEVLSHDLLVTPPFTRVSRMIRDISAEDILVGSKKANLRQEVEASDVLKGAPVREIRFREIAGEDIAINELELEEVAYETSNTHERFLQWVTPEGKIAGFLRLSLPKTQQLVACAFELPEELGEAMIREVHVYGQVANLHKTDGSAQHLGLGKRLIDRACQIAREAGFNTINVISSVGTREYYRKLGFHDGNLYQRKQLDAETDTLA